MVACKSITPLADFRSHPGDALDDLLTDNVASLMAAGAVKLKAAAQDGMRVRASAGAASFRREEKLKACLEAAREQVSSLKARVDDDPVGETARKQTAQRRAAEERKRASKPPWLGCPNWRRSRRVKERTRRKPVPRPPMLTQRS